MYNASGTSITPSSADTSDLAESKVAIPRVRITEPRQKLTTHRDRVSHACEECRRRKRKCDGQRPECGDCKAALLTCRYGDGKRNLAKKKMKRLEEKVKLYENLLDRLRPSLDPAGQLAIQNALVGVSESAANSPIAFRSPDDGASLAGDFLYRSPATKSDSGESDASVEEGSSGSLDRLVYDINTSTINNPVGFMGKGTEVSWLQHLKDELQVDTPLEARAEAQSSQHGGSGKRRASESGVIGSTYHLDDLDISLAKTQVDIYIVPEKPIADGLIDAYFTTVHPLFPIIHKPSFLSQYALLYSSEDPSSVSGKWLAILNLIFAIGQRYYDMTGSYQRTETAQHLIFFTRARILGALDGGVLFGIATLEDVQTMGLVGMYFLAGKQTNRSWNVVGHAVRLSYGIGLHLHNVAQTLSALQKEMRIRVWYSVYYLETTISLTTGRPSALRECENSAPIPRTTDRNIQFDRAPDNYFSALMKLSIISAEVSSKLYSARSTNVKRNWVQVQQTMESLNKSLESWKSKLPAVLSFETDQFDKTFVSQRVDLSFRYYNILILIYRPCLCRFTGRVIESQEAQEFFQNSATICVQSAHSIIEIIVNGEEVVHHFRTLPWWCLLYYLVSAVAILMLEMVYKISHKPDSEHAQSNTLFEVSCKTLQWLKDLSRTDLASQRAYSQLSKLMSYVATGLGKRFDLTDDSTMDHDSYSDQPSVLNEHTWLSQDLSVLMTEDLQRSSDVLSPAWYGDPQNVNW
ncbi:fungal-specific transcription factor domain-containing protein [Trichophaea hybrida]|nr:fungal-specific transcription factor domain-containing protein [Trichophaea hybrida]